MATQHEIRQEVTQKIVDALQRGVAPWRRPWRTDLTNTGTPANAVSSKAYRGTNVLLLGMTGFGSRWWATFPQIRTLGGRVKKGERATRIIYWRQVEKVTASQNGHDLVESFPLLKTYCVFNIEQCEGDGIERFMARPCTATPFVDFIPAEQVIAATNACIVYGGSKAAYYPDKDFISLPPKQSFESQREYYSTALHELGHWSGHDSRLNRIVKNTRFGSAAYSFEELVAEISGCFLSNEVSIPQSDDLGNQASYLQSWLSVLQADPSALFTAASQASQATDFILAFGRKETSGAGEENETALAGVGE